VTLNFLEKKLDLKCCESCIEFNTGTEIEEDDRLVKSYPTSPREYKNFDGLDWANFGKTFDNCYADAKEPKDKGDKEYSNMGTQAQPSEILIALARKGGDLVAPGIDKNDFSNRRNLKKKRGRKNKYYRQIDQEDDEEADAMSDGSDDGLDGIKEEDDEDEDDRLKKLAKMKELEDAAVKKAEDKEWKELCQKKVEIDEL